MKYDLYMIFYFSIQYIGLSFTMTDQDPVQEYQTIINTFSNCISPHRYEKKRTRHIGTEKSIQVEGVGGNFRSTNFLGFF